MEHDKFQLFSDLKDKTVYVVKYLKCKVCVQIGLDSLNLSYPSNTLIREIYDDIRKHLNHDSFTIDENFLYPIGHYHDLNIHVTINLDPVIVSYRGTIVLSLTDARSVNNLRYKVEQVIGHDKFNLYHGNHQLKLNMSLGVIKNVTIRLEDESYTDSILLEILKSN